MLTEEVIFINSLKITSPSTTDFWKVIAGTSYVPRILCNKQTCLCNKKQTVLNYLVVHQRPDIVLSVPQMFKVEWQTRKETGYPSQVAGFEVLKATSY